MTERLKFKVDLQEALLRKENDEIMKDGDKDGNENNVEKRFTKEQIKEYIKKKMDKVKRDLDGTVKDI